MANYSLVLDTRFKPFSYQEMLAPVAAATQAHQALEEEYGNLATKASVWEEMANEQTDPYAYRMYKNYSNDLASKADQLLKYGLNPASRKDMLGMRARYSKEIVPIENAYKRREELAAEQRKARASNPTLFFQRDMASTSLDDFIRNPSLDYGANYSGALLAQQAGQIASNLKNVFTGRSKLKGTGLPFQYEQLIQYGYTPEQIQEAITNPKEGNPILTAIVDQVLASSGMNRWATADQMMQARAYANQGLYNAIGKTDIKNFTDSYSMQNALEAAKEGRDARRKRKEAEEKERIDALKMYRTNSTSLYSDSEVARQNRNELEKIERWKSKGLLNKDGKISVAGGRSIKAYLEYNERNKNRDMPYGPTDLVFHNKEFAQWAMSHGLKTSVKTTKIPQQNRRVGDSMNTYEPFITGVDKVNAEVQNMISRASSGELATGVANIKVGRVRVDSKNTSDNLVDLITSAGGNIIMVGELNADGTLKEGSSITAEDFVKLVKGTDSKPGQRIVHLANSHIGNQQFVELANGQKFFIPSSVFGDSVVDPRNRTGDLDITNAILRAEDTSDINNISDRALGAFAYSQSYLSTLLDASSGSNIDYKGSIVEETMNNGKP